MHLVSFVEILRLFLIQFYADVVIQLENSVCDLRALGCIT